MAKFTFIFMLFEIDSANEIPVSVDSPIKLPTPSDRNTFIEEQIMSTRYDENINLVIIKTAPTETPLLKNTTFATNVYYLIEADTESKKKGFNYVKGSPVGYGSLNIGSADTLGVLLSSIRLNCKSDHYIVYTNNHSNNFGALSKQLFLYQNTYPLLIQSTKALQFTTKIIPRPPLTHITLELVEKPTIDMLTYSELSKAIEKGFCINSFDDQGKNKQLDLLVMVSCYGSTIDNLAIFAKTVKYVCSSEGTVFYNFINTKKLVEYILDKDSIEDGMELLFSKINKDANDRKNNQMNSFAKKYIKPTIYSMFNLEKTSEFINKLNTLLILILKENSLIKFINNSTVFNPNNPFKEYLDIHYILDKWPPSAKENKDNIKTHCIDFIELLNILQTKGIENETVNTQFQQLINDLKDIYTKEILFIPPHLDITKNTVDGRRHFHGISCFLPFALEELDETTSNQMAYSYSIFSPFKTDFAKQTLWPEFLQSIFKRNIY